MAHLDDVITIGENNLVGWDGLKNELTNSYVPDATVTAQLQTAAGSNVGSPVVCTYIANSRGTYIGVLSKLVTATLDNGETYQIVYSVNDGDGLRTVPMTARKHGKR